MMKKIALPVLMLLALPVYGETGYVTDSFEITLRTGQGVQHKILKNLASGTHLEIVQTDEENGYTLVRTDDGTEGWVLSRYLIKQPVAKQRLIRANKRIVSLKKELDGSKTQLKQLRSDYQSLQKQHDKTSSSNTRIQKELEQIRRISSKEIRLHDENEKLKTDLLTMERKLQTLEQDNIALKDRSDRDWFLIGAAVCVFGILLGLILPRLRNKKSASWGSL